MVYDSLVCESQELLATGDEEEERSITMNIIDKLSEKRCVCLLRFSLAQLTAALYTLKRKSILNFSLMFLFNSILVYTIFSFLMMKYLSLII